ncbi:unnamed protein product, partial [Schistosoma turkestanicum]
MRNTALSGWLISLYLVGAILLKFLKSDDVCEQFVNFLPVYYENISFINESIRKSDHYYYTQVIRRNSEYSSVISGRRQMNPGQIYKSPFPIEFFGERYDSFSLDNSGKMQFHNPGNEITSGGIILSTISSKTSLFSCSLT